TSAGGGGLATDYAFAPNAIFLSTCFGGVCLYSSTNPGFITRSDAPSSDLFPLADGSGVSMEVLSIDDEVSVLVGAKLLDAAGEPASLGAAPGLPLHPTWQVTVPAGPPAQSSFSVTFRLTSATSSYTASPSYTLALVLPGAEPTPTPTAVATFTPAIT